MWLKVSMIQWTYIYWRRKKWTTNICCSITEQTMLWKKPDTKECIVFWGPANLAQWQWMKHYSRIFILLQLFPTTDPVGTLLQVPEEISAHLPQPAGQTPAQPTQVSLPPPAEPAKTAQVKQGHALVVSLWEDVKSGEECAHIIRW